MNKSDPSSGDAERGCLLDDLARSGDRGGGDMEIDKFLVSPIRTRLPPSRCSETSGDLVLGLRCGGGSSRFSGRDADRAETFRGEADERALGEEGEGIKFGVEVTPAVREFGEYGPGIGDFLPCPDRMRD